VSKLLNKRGKLVKLDQWVPRIKARVWKKKERKEEISGWAARK
jgi:hypothetical protein